MYGLPTASLMGSNTPVSFPLPVTDGRQPLFEIALTRGLENLPCNFALAKTWHNYRGSIPFRAILVASSWLIAGEYRFHLFALSVTALTDSFMSGPGSAKPHAM